MPRIKILDCTLRDGGYVNNWNFDSKVVIEAIHGLSVAGVDIIEVGYLDEKRERMREPCLIRQLRWIGV